MLSSPQSSPAHGPTPARPAAAGARGRTGLVVLALIAAACTACGSDSDSSGASSASPASASSAAGTTAAAPSPSPTVTALPESVLQPLPEMAYRRSGEVEVPAGMQESASWVSGFLSRAIVLKGVEVGRVQVIRLTDGLADAEAEARVASLITSYLGGAAPATQTIEGREVMIGERVKGTTTSVAIFRPSDRDIVLLSSAQGLAATVSMTRVWLASTAPAK